MMITHDIHLTKVLVILLITHDIHLYMVLWIVMITHDTDIHLYRVLLMVMLTHDVQLSHKARVGKNKNNPQLNEFWPHLIQLNSTPITDKDKAHQSHCSSTGT